MRARGRLDPPLENAGAVRARARFTLSGLSRVSFLVPSAAFSLKNSGTLGRTDGRIFDFLDRDISQNASERRKQIPREAWRNCR